MSKYVKVGTIKKTVPVEDASASSASKTTERAADTTDSSPTNSQVGHAAESKGTDQADHGAKSEHIAESKEDGPAGHGNEGEYKAESRGRQCMVMKLMLLTIVQIQRKTVQVKEPKNSSNYCIKFLNSLDLRYLK